MFQPRYVPSGASRSTVGTPPSSLPSASAYEASYVPTALGLAKAGLGVAVIAYSAADAAATEAAGLRARVIEHPALVRQISLIESARRSLSPAARELVAAIRVTGTTPAPPE
jgi:DNA-binding transcriptional LysR family regulator